MWMRFGRSCEGVIFHSIRDSGFIWSSTVTTSTLCVTSGCDPQRPNELAFARYVKLPYRGQVQNTAFLFIQAVLVVVPLDEPLRGLFVVVSVRETVVRWWVRATCHSSLLLRLSERFGYCEHRTVNTHTVREGEV
jgi:hypothetical protein